MARISHHVLAAMMSFLLATSLTAVAASGTPPSYPPQASASSSRDKACFDCLFQNSRITGAM